MNIRRSLFTPFAISTLIFFAGALSAVSGQSTIGDGLILHKEVQSKGMMGQGGNETSTTYLSQTALREESSDGSDMIMYLAERRFVLIDHEKKTYSEISVDDLQNRLDEVSKAMSDPENQQAMEMLKQMMGGGSGEVTVRHIGDGGSVAGFSTQKYEIKMAPMEMTLWATPEIEPPAAYFDMMNFNIARNPLFDTAQLIEAFRQVEGFPIKTETRMKLMGMNMETVSEVTNVERGAIDPAKFELPAGYKKSELKF
ncbi:MAG TPA: DUF4412 domain-containing protein [Acidobacteriota bacterium]|nr:DUF4412 domain-containing protein [Acidobacteriota bacterium]